MLRRLTALVSCAALAGCSTGYSRGVMEKELAAAKVAYVSRDLSIAEIDALKPQVPLPARIAVAPPREGWTPEEVAVLESWEEPLRAAGIASILLVLPAALVRDCDGRDAGCRLAEVRTAAARAHADAILVVNFATDTDRYVNPASALYLSLVGLWLVPGSHANALTVADGVLIDNRNEYLYAFARGEGESKSLRPQMYLDQDAVVAESRVAALRDFGRAFLREAGRLKVVSDSK